MDLMTTARTRVATVAVAIVAVAATAVGAGTTASVSIRGHAQTLHLYGRRGGAAVVVSSGDGGWIHLAPHVAEVLAARGFFVVGFDARAYLEDFTTARTSLRSEDEPRDFKVLVDYAAGGAAGRPILLGVSEGAGLSVLAATDPETRQAIAGVIGLGLPNLNELGWRWRDSLIYVTHAAPNEPSFSTAAVIGRVSPAPIATIHSTHDEFVPMTEVQRVMEAAREPKRLWFVDAANHRFSDNLPEFDRRLIEAVAWVQANAAR